MTNKELLDKIYDKLKAMTETAFDEWDKALRKPVVVSEDDPNGYNPKESMLKRGRVEGLMQAKDIIYDLYREVND